MQIESKVGHQVPIFIKKGGTNYFEVCEKFYIWNQNLKFNRSYLNSDRYTEPQMVYKRSNRQSSSLVSSCWIAIIKLKLKYK